MDTGEQTPLELLLLEMRNGKNPLSVRLDLAVKAAPYCSARLAAIDAQVEGADLIINLINYDDARAEPAKPDAEGLSDARLAGNGKGRP